MKKIILFISINLILITLFSCNSGNEIKKTPEELYSENAANLLNEFIEKNKDCKCILEQSKASYLDLILEERPGMNVEEYIQNLMVDLQINRRSAFDSVNKLSKTFDLKNYLQNSSKAIKIIKGIDTIESIESLKRWRENVYKQCPQGLYYVYNPIFNENFTRVIFDYTSGFSCLRFPPDILVCQNGTWFGESYFE